MIPSVKLVITESDLKPFPLPPVTGRLDHLIQIKDGTLFSLQCNINAKKLSFSNSNSLRKLIAVEYHAVWEKETPFSYTFGKIIHLKIIPKVYLLHNQHYH